jgi:regulator of sirC expression with transglutaminase-like and TPR domain
MNADIETLGLLDDDEIELDFAALALSALDHEGLDLEAYYELLDDIGERLADFADAETPEEQAAALAQVFHREFGFTGDSDAYDVPLNADLVRVLDRRRGLPVSLSLLYVAAARRIGWHAWATNTPGHVLVRVGGGGGGGGGESLDDSEDLGKDDGDEPAVLIDPFHGGAPVGGERLALLLRAALGPGGVPAPEHLAPMSNRAVLVRLLLNQASRAEQSADPLRAMTLYERMSVIAPDNADGWWELARLQLQVQDTDAARHSLSAMLEVTRDPQRRALVSATLRAIAGA